MITLCLTSKKTQTKLNKKKHVKKIRIIIFRILPAAALIIQVI